MSEHKKCHDDLKNGRENRKRARGEGEEAEALAAAEVEGEVKVPKVGTAAI